MQVFIGPVSGAKFASQIALYMEIYKIIEPSLILGSSGGAVSSFIYLAADGNPDGIERICHSLNNRLLTSSWWTNYLDFLPSSIIGFFKGTIYSKGQGTDEVMKKIFSTYNISRIEMLIGTTNRESSKQQIFSNRNEEDSIMKNIPFECKMNNCLPIKYVKGDILKISKVCTASSSIPVLFPDQMIDDQYYIDGGTTFTSPLTPLCDSLDFIGSNKKMHLVYFNSFDIESTLEEGKYYNLVQNTDQTLSAVLRSLAIQDRLKGIELIKKSIYRNKLNLLYFEGKCNTDI
jgi:predicted acylesterase/phospholipase RssA